LTQIHREKGLCLSLDDFVFITHLYLERVSRESYRIVRKRSQHACRREIHKNGTNAAISEYFNINS
jgi:hypothetical protein